MNDISRHGGLPRTPRRRVLQSFDGLISSLSVLAPVIVVGPLPVYAPKMPYHSVITGLDLDFRNDDILEMNVAYQKICETKGVPFLSVFSALAESEIYNRSLGKGDGLHPGGEGYQALTDLIAVWPDWKRLVG